MMQFVQFIWLIFFLAWIEIELIFLATYWFYMIIFNMSQMEHIESYG